MGARTPPHPLRRPAVLILLGLVGLWGCRHGPAPGPAPIQDGEVGVASWYGEEFDGRPTASGEVFDMDELTAAHRTLPFGTRLRVVDLETGRDVIVRINDRGPFVKNRIIDLSRGAARVLGILDRGTTRVRLEILELGERDGDPGVLYVLHVGSFALRANAQRLAERLREMVEPVELRSVWLDGRTLWRVYAGRFGRRSDARDAARRLERRLDLDGLLVVRKTW